MYYHIRIDKIKHDGRTDMDARFRWDFRSLNKALAMISSTFGGAAKCWRIQDLTERTPDIMQLENDLRVALESTYQFIVMTFKDCIPATDKYDHFEFFVVKRDEAEYPPKFSYTEKEENAISPCATSNRVFVDLYKHPIDAKVVSYVTPIYDNEKDVFSGMAIMFKNGDYFLVVAGIDQDEEQLNLGAKGIDKFLIDKILPSTPNGTDLHGFIVRLKNGNSLYLTIGSMIHPDKSIKKVSQTTLTPRTPNAVETTVRQDKKGDSQHE